MQRVNLRKRARYLRETPNDMQNALLAAGELNWEVAADGGGEAMRSKEEKGGGGDDVGS